MCTHVSLTHVQLSYETGHIAVLEVKRQQILRELDLVHYDEAATGLQARMCVFGDQINKWVSFRLLTGASVGYRTLRTRTYLRPADEVVVVLIVH